MIGKKILVVDDDEDMRRGLGIRLKASGYNVVLAHDAISATGMARKEKPDLIILDIGLPGGDGFIVMERLVSITETSVPFIVVTGRDPSTNRKRALDAGARAFFLKPADNDQLLAAIEKVLGETERPAPTAGPHGPSKEYWDLSTDD
ncbi:MAG: response regulator transcription factor [candidate division NC10 bacterium]|nr:response regulator transcription factor [candidate division NC10 bacterium]MDE2322397.1 response regulator transcription factor [candidate division NC10 bacterium]